MFIISLNTCVFSRNQKAAPQGQGARGPEALLGQCSLTGVFPPLLQCSGEEAPRHTPRQAALGPRPPVRAGARGCLTRAGATREPLPPRGRTRALPPGQRGQARDTRALAWSGNASAPAQPQPKPGTRRRRAARAEAAAGAAGALFLSSKTVQTM